MTGRSPVAARMTRFSSPLPRDEVTFPELLRSEGGYFTGVCGRSFHLDGPGNRAGGEVAEMLATHNLKTFSARVDFLNTCQDDEVPAQISNFLDRKPSDKPFFMWANFSDPHHVWNAPAEFRPDPAALKLPAHWPDLPAVREQLADYCAEVNRVDASVGKVLKLLESRKLLDSTLIVFTGDNGAALPHGKGSLYDPGSNVPMIVRWPGNIQAGTNSRELLSGEDIGPTLLSVAGIQKPARMTGVSFLPLLKGAQHLPRKHVFVERGPHGSAPVSVNMSSSGYDLSRAVRSDRYKFIYNCTPWIPYSPVDSAGGAAWKAMQDANSRGHLTPGLTATYFATPRPVYELYDLETDPSELVNLSGRKDLARIEQELRAALAEKMILDFDYLPLPAMLTTQPAAGGAATGNGNRSQRTRQIPPNTDWTADSSQLFGEEYPKLDSLAVGQWWTKKPPAQNPPPTLDVPRDSVIAFAIYTFDSGVLKLTAQLFPLKPDESRDVRLELERDGQWQLAKTEPIQYPGWSAHFRIEPWAGNRDVRYRIRHGLSATFEGIIRRDPRDKDEIVVATMSCNSSRTTGQRPEIIENLKFQNPDLLFFAGDQTYRHTEHTAGWIEFGLQFRELIRDRPAICIPDDHDVGHGNLWGENGKRSNLSGNADGGYMFPAKYVNLVQRQQTWHLPDPADAKPIEQGIEVYFTRLRVGGIDFAILEDRKFKSGPAGKIPPMGPRPDHINDPNYDPKTIDLPGLELLGSRQERFLRLWSDDWQGADLKAVLSQTAFCGAVHIHGGVNNRLLADLDCNGWPQSKRNHALEALRRIQAVHLCGDQHLAVTVKHGINQFGDGPYAFTSPALVNTIYGRWWHPLDEKPGNNSVKNSPLPWTGEFRDGLGNPITMLAYANPVKIADEKQRADGYGIARFHKRNRTVTFECWPRFSNAHAGNSQQFPGWPITISVRDNDGRKPTAWLPRLNFSVENPVVKVVDETNNDVLYVIRAQGRAFRPYVFHPGKYRISIGKDNPNSVELKNIGTIAENDSGSIDISLN